MQETLAAAADVAPTPTTVLLVGERGAGKGLLARYIHARSGRGTSRFVAVECAALPSDRIDLEVFGGAPGAGEDATSARDGGCFARAAGGTLFFDEISELPLALQARLLRAIQLQEAERSAAGSEAEAASELREVRIIATSSRDLLQLVSQGAFRSDLYYRLNVFPIAVPSLRERREDLPQIAEQLLDQAAQRLGRLAPALGDDALRALLAHDFPGNVRELANLLERALVRCRGSTIEARLFGFDVLPPPSRAGAASLSERLPPGLPLDLTELERLAIHEALHRVGGNRTRAARLLGIGLRTLRNRLRVWRETEAGLRLPPDPEACMAAGELPARSSQSEIS
jgi:DNA-binding NtrC family response regulator